MSPSKPLWPESPRIREEIHDALRSAPALTVPELRAYVGHSVKTLTYQVQAMVRAGDLEDCGKQPGCRSRSYRLASP